MQFDHPEDRALFCCLLAEGSEYRFEREFAHLFDFRPPAVKKQEFRGIRDRMLSQLVARYEAVCQLQLHPDCSREKIWQLDHLVPLSTNELNKRLRALPRIGNAKVASQSFGSNHADNLILTCKRCNAFKKSRAHCWFAAERAASLADATPPCGVRVDTV